MEIGRASQRRAWLPQRGLVLVVLATATWTGSTVAHPLVAGTCQSFDVGFAPAIYASGNMVAGDLNADGRPDLSL